MEQELKLCRPTRWQYFRTFAGCHFLLSLIGVLGGFLCLSSAALLDGHFIILLLLWDVVLMLLYTVIGHWAAGEMEWSSPRRFLDRLGAFLVPTLVAWVWGGAFLLMLSHYGSLDAAAGNALANILFWGTLLFAFPSSVGWGALGGGLLLGGYSYEPVVRITAMLVVGFLPPLLFLLGVILKSRKQEKKQLQISE